MSNFLSVINKIFEKIELNIIFATTWLFALVFVILPKSITNSLGMAGFKENWQFVISLVFIILTCYYIASFVIPKIAKFIEDARLKMNLPKIKQSLHNLTKDEQDCLMNFYDIGTKQFNLTATLDISNAVTNVLTGKVIISRGSTVSQVGMEFDYFLQPYALEELNDMLRKKIIVVNAPNNSCPTYGHTYDDKPNYQWKNK